MTRRIEIADPDPGWAAHFDTLAALLRTTLGEVALRIDHIGSTSVPGLAAKDIIDIQVTVAVLDEPVLRPLLEGAGFVWLHGFRDSAAAGMGAADDDLSKHLLTADAPLRTANVHIREEGRFNQRFALLFRDFLRASPAATASYETIKHELVALVGDDADGYYAVKEPVMQLIHVAAEEWAMRTGWLPGPTDG